MTLMHIHTTFVDNDKSFMIDDQFLNLRMSTGLSYNESKKDHRCHDHFMIIDRDVSQFTESVPQISRTAKNCPQQ